MAPASTSSSPVASRDTTMAEDENATPRADTRQDRAGDMDEKTNQGEPVTESDSSLQEQVKEFKEGGYGWYVNVQ